LQKKPSNDDFLCRLARRSSLDIAIINSLQSKHTITNSSSKSMM